jgi:hypothetical protein
VNKNGDALKSLYSTWCSVGLLYASLVLVPANAAEIAGVTVKFVDYSGPAELSVEATDKYALRINTDPKSERKALTLQVELPIAGPSTWPFIDVVVFDSEANALPVRRGGIEWHKLLITVPPERSTFLVRAVEPEVGWPKFRSENDRHATDHPHHE